MEFPQTTQTDMHTTGNKFREKVKAEAVVYKCREVFLKRAEKQGHPQAPSEWVTAVNA